MGLLKHGDKVEAESMFRERFDDVVNSGNPWIAMVGRFTPDGRVEIFRTTSNFPQERFLDVVAELRKTLIEELHGGLLPDAPLPKARLMTHRSLGVPALPTVKPSDVRYPDDFEKASDSPGEDNETPGDEE